jgi:hypothetical protein
MASLRIPSALSVATLAALASGCAPRPAPDDARADDARTDGATSDGSACVPDDAMPYPDRLCGRTDGDGGLTSCGPACSNGTCSGDCRLCVASRFYGTVGIQCLPRAGSTAACPPSVCQPSDCPAGCETCEAPLFCIPDPTMADGGSDRCVTSNTCDPAGCGPGCRAVG